MDSNPFTNPDAPVPSIPPGACCATHPAASATARCVDCGTLTCGECGLALADGGHACARCMERRAARSMNAVFEMPTEPTLGASGGGKLKLRTRGNDAFPSAPVPVTLAPALAQGQELRCMQHPKAAAIASCDTCHGLICATCMFEVPGQLHLCPNCALNCRIKLSSGRMWAMIGGFVLAAIGTTGFGLLLTGVLVQLVAERMDLRMLGYLILLVIAVPSLVGMALTFGAMDKKLGNPPVLWVAAIWNLVIAASFLVMTLL